MRVSWGRAVGWTAYLGLLGAVGSGAALYGWAKRNAPKATDAAIRQVVAPPPVRSVFGTDALTVLLLGCDDSFLPDGTLAEGPSRSDMMMLVRLDFAQRRVGGVSIPRDTVMRLPGEPHHRINAYHALGGPELSKKAVEWLTKAKVDRVATLDSWEFMEIVNTLGGVTVVSPKKLEYTDRSGGLYIRVAQGTNSMNGYQALGFVRFRHDDDDLARQARQRAFLLAVKERAKADPGAALRSVDRMVPLFRGTFTQDELLSLVRWGVSLGAERIHLTGWPVRPIPRSPTLVTVRGKAADTLGAAGFAPALGDPADPGPDKGAVEAFAGPLPQPLGENRIPGNDRLPEGVRPVTERQARRP
jgi:LCP family protein required for cell wall assembly